MKRKIAHALAATVLALPLTIGVALVGGGAAHAMPSATLVISELRLRGPNGANDEFIEIANIAAGTVTRLQKYPSLGHGFIHTTGICAAARQAVVNIAREWRALLGTNEGSDRAR